MIKIVINGVQIEVNSTQDAVELIKGFEVKRDNTPKVVKPTKTIRRKRFSTKAHWTNDELRAMLAYIKMQNATPSEISKDKDLRDRHSKHGIVSMYHKLMNNRHLSQKVIGQLKEIM